MATGRGINNNNRYVEPPITDRLSGKPTGRGQPPTKAVPIVTTGAGAGRGGQGGPTAQELDSWAHQPNNIVAGDEFKLQFLPNILDNFDVSTYHFKLFMVSTENAAAGAVLDSANQVIIAESGISDLTIDKIELQGIAGPSVESGTGTQTLLKFEIIEPSGAGLLDKMFYQATALGIGNWLVMPCYLQLEFKGRDPKTSESSSTGAPGALGGLKWIWPIKLTNAKANVTQVGTKYEFDAIMYDELAQSNSYFAIQHNIVLSGLTNFGDAMRDLEDKLNADQYAKLIDNYSIPDTFQIIVDPDLKKLSIVDPSDTKSTSFGADFSKFKDKTASFNPGTGIDKIIDAILGNTKEFQKAMQASDTAAGQPKPIQAQKDQMKKLWRIVTETRPIKFDMLRQDNAVAVIIYIVKYDLGMVDVNPSQTGQTPETIAADRRRMLEYVKKKILNKKYNYIFTGLNDQIINFDLNMNFSFAASLARFGGVYYDSAISMPGVAVQKASDEAGKKAADALRATLNLLNTSTDNKQIEAKIKETQTAINDVNLDPVLRAKYSELLKHAKKADRQQYTKKILASNGQNAGGDLDTEKNNAKYLAQPMSTTNGNGKPVTLRFISDVNIDSTDAKQAFESAKASRKGKLRPIAFREGMQERSLIATDPSSDAGRSRVANVFSTALYSTLDASLQYVKLTIKGDPYWLFPRRIDSGTTLLPRLSIDRIKDTVNTDSVNTMCTDNFVVIRFRTPRIYNTTTGSTDPFTEAEAFSGVYKVITITSKFEMGKFTQELTCILDPVINLSEFIKEIENSSKTNDKIVSANDTTTPVSIVPEISIKTQKIMGQADALKGQDQTVRNSITGIAQNLQTQVSGNVLPSLSNIPDPRRII